MKRRHHQGLTVEILEERLALSGAQSTLNRAYLPFSLLTIPGRFQADVPVVVTFHDRNHDSVAVESRSVTAKAVTVVVPVFLNTRTGQSTAAPVVDVTVNNGVVKAPHQASGRFRVSIADLPPTGLPAGTLLAAFGTATQQLINAAIANYGQITFAAQGLISTGQVVRDLVSLSRSIDQVEQALAPLATGAVSSVSLGNFGAFSPVLDRGSLAFMDRSIAAVIDNPTGTHPLGRPLRGQALVNRLQQLVFNAAAAGPSAVLQGADRLVDVLTTAATPGPMPVIPVGTLVAGGTLGAVAGVIAASAAQSGTIFDALPLVKNPQARALIQSHDLALVKQYLDSPVLNQDLNSVAVSGLFVPNPGAGAALFNASRAAFDLSTQLDPSNPHTPFMRQPGFGNYLGETYQIDLLAIDEFLSMH